MILILIASVALGLGAAGVVLGLARLSGGRLPRWAAPVAGGLAMFAFMLWNEYSWFDRAVAGLPGDAAVAETYPHSSWLQPWTLAVPRIARFAAVAPSGPAPEGYRRADVLLVTRFEGIRVLPHLFDCATGRRALLPGGELPGGAERLAALDWTDPEGEAPLVRAACALPEPG